MGTGSGQPSKKSSTDPGAWPITWNHAATSMRTTAGRSRRRARHIKRNGGDVEKSLATISSAGSIKAGARQRLCPSRCSSR